MYMKSISFWVAKGGTGKTTTTGNVAYAMAKQGARVVVIDADPQGNLSSWLLSEAPQHELADVLYGDGFPEVNVISAAVSVRDNLDLIPTFALGGRLSTWADTAAPAEPFAIADLIDSLRLSRHYDVALFDLGPGTSTFGKIVNAAVDTIVPVMLPEYFSVDGFEIFNEYLDELRSKRRASVQAGPVIANRVHNGYATHGVYKELAAYIVGQSTDISDCVPHHATVAEYAPRNKWVPVYSEIAGALWR